MQATIIIPCYPPWSLCLRECTLRLMRNFADVVRSAGIAITVGWADREWGFGNHVTDATSRFFLEGKFRKLMQWGTRSRH